MTVLSRIEIIETQFRPGVTLKATSGVSQYISEICCAALRALRYLADYFFRLLSLPPVAWGQYRLTVILSPILGISGRSRGGCLGNGKLA